MTEVTDQDREKARSMVVEWTRGENLWLTDAIAAALAEERERERLAWNPMIGRVIQVAQALEREAPEQEAWDGNVQAAYREIAERINRAIEGAP